jgi:uncharacterized SAM-dependent methyltransferase
LLETLEEVDPAFRADVLNGLAEPIPAIPARWFYDRRGSELFDEITRLPAYYPTRTETALLEAIIPEVARLVAPACAVVEFGAGSATKTPILLRALDSSPARQSAISFRKAPPTYCATSEPSSARARSC